MFCPNCGNPDQQAGTYCRQCGEFTPNLTGKNKLAFGGGTPEEQIRVNLFLNLLSAIVSFVLAIVLYATFWNKGGEFPVIYVVAGFLLAMSGWQISTFIVGLKLKKNFEKRKFSAEENQANQESAKTFGSAKTRELLNEPDFGNVVPTSVVENTTKHLAEKINRKSSQTEQ